MEGYGRRADYERDYYQTRDAATRPVARAVTGRLLDLLPPVRSAVDFGCGVGAWLAALREQGAERVLGLDGDWVSRDLLAIEAAEFRPARLEQPQELGERFDLAISLEVAEHLPPEASAGFVENLTRAADLVLFSAAIPGQAGTRHVNLRWQSEWQALFRQRGYRAFDVLRPAFWNDASIPWYYRQNLLVYARAARKDLCGPLETAAGASPAIVDLVHPELHLRLVRKQRSVRKLLKVLSRRLGERLTGRPSASY